VENIKTLSEPSDNSKIFYLQQNQNFWDIDTFQWDSALCVSKISWIWGIHTWAWCIGYRLRIPFKPHHLLTCSGSCSTKCPESQLYFVYPNPTLGARRHKDQMLQTLETSSTAEQERQRGLKGNAFH